MNLPYDYMPLVMAVIEKITDGVTETSACDELGLSISTFKLYINRDPELQDLYAEALQRGYDALADALLNPMNHALYGHSDPKMAKVQSDNIKWFLEKRDAKRFGQRVEVNHHITADKAITAALTASRNRIAQIEHQPAEIIDAEYAEVFEDEDAELMAEMGLA